MKRRAASRNAAFSGLPLLAAWRDNDKATQRIEIPLESLRSVFPLAISTSCATRASNAASCRFAAACISVLIAASRAKST